MTGLQTAPAYLGSGNFQHPAVLDRDIIRRFSGKKTGVFGSTDFVVAPTTGLNVTITGGAASMIGTDSPANQGHYFAWSDGTQTVACVAAHASLKRVDALVLRVVDAAYSAGFTQEAKWEWVSGTPASSPTTPTDSDITAVYRPGSWIRIANVQINNGDTVVDPSRIFDTRTWTTNANGLIYAATAAGRTAIINKDVGDKCWQLDTKMEWTWDGTYWLPQIGQTVFKGTRSGAGTITSGTVIPLDATDDWDLLAGHDPAGANPERYTFNIPGKFEMAFGTPHGVIAAGSAIILIPRINNVAVNLGTTVSANSSGSAGTRISFVEEWQFAVNDYFSAQIGNNVGTAVQAAGAWMTAKYLGP